MRRGTITCSNDLSRLRPDVPSPELLLGEQSVPAAEIRIRRVRSLGRPVPKALTEAVRHGRDPQRLEQTAEIEVLQL